MNKRHYPFSEEYFNQHLKSYIINLKDGRGRPSLISDYQFFVEYYMCYEQEYRGGISLVVMALGTQFICALKVGVNLGGFGSY